MNIKVALILIALASVITATTEAGPGPTRVPTAASRKVATQQVINSCPRCPSPVVSNGAAVVARGMRKPGNSSGSNTI